MGDIPEPAYSAAETFTRCRECGKLFGLPHASGLSMTGYREAALRFYRAHYEREHGAPSSPQETGSDR